MADACPGRIATQVGQGVLWSLFTITGVVGGRSLAQRSSATMRVGVSMRRGAARHQQLDAVGRLRSTGHGSLKLDSAFRDQPASASAGSR